MLVKMIWIEYKRSKRFPWNAIISPFNSIGWTVFHWLKGFLPRCENKLKTVDPDVLLVIGSCFINMHMGTCQYAIKHKHTKVWSVIEISTVTKEHGFKFCLSVFGNSRSVCHSCPTFPAGEQKKPKFCNRRSLCANIFWYNSF